ncbi:MAG: protein translocase subunit SecD [Deltaproteobacteria bacterium]|nr:protein translocase subunit SecD [Deltaproteobacteria bacterium]
MERKWYWKVGFWVALLLIGVAASLTSFVPRPADGAKPDILPKSLRKLFPGINMGLDLQGGIRLVYEVQVDSAVQDKRDHMAHAIVQQFEEKAELKGVKFIRSREDSRKFDLVFPSEGDRQAEDVRVILKDFRQSVTVEMEEGAVSHCIMVEALVNDTRDMAVKQAIETIGNRIDELGLANTTVAPRGVDIIVEIPGVDERQITRIKRIISTTARLEFKIVDESGSEKFFEPLSEKLVKDGPIKLQKERVQAGEEGTVWSYYLEAKDQPGGKTGRQILKEFLKDKQLPDNRSVGFQRRQATDEAGNPTPDVVWRTFYMDATAGITGDYVDTAMVANDDQSGQPYVSLSFSQAGADIFAKLTEKNVKRRMAIQLDDKVNSAPVIQEKIGGGQCRITLGGYEAYNKLYTEAQDLVVVLRAGALPAPVRPITETTIGPAMGRDAIALGKMAAVVGTVLVLLFMAVYYRGSGVAANVALIVNLFAIIAILGGAGATLTLPGIGGIVLTMGMSVDANVIIYERIREELRGGKSPRAAVETGYARAFWTIFDSHLTNFIAGVVLLQYGTGPIKGFAVTLLVGIATSLFTAIYVSRIVLDWLTRNRAERLSI